MGNTHARVNNPRSGCLVDVWESKSLRVVERLPLQVNGCWASAVELILDEYLAKSIVLADAYLSQDTVDRRNTLGRTLLLDEYLGAGIVTGCLPWHGRRSWMNTVAVLHCHSMNA